jgi:hypothetical protein
MIFLGGKWRPERKADNPTVIWASTTCYRDNFTILLAVHLLLMNGKGCGKNGACPISRQYPGIPLGKVRKTTKKNQAG